MGNYTTVHRILRPRHPFTKDLTTVGARSRLDTTQPTPRSRGVSLRPTLQLRRRNGIDMPSWSQLWENMTSPIKPEVGNIPKRRE